MRPIYSGFIGCFMLMAGCIFDVQLGDIAAATDPPIAPPTPDCVVITPQNMNFGAVNVGESATRTVTLTNQCEQAVTVTSVTLLGDSAFTLVSDPVGTLDRTVITPIAPGVTIEATVLFQPNQDALTRGELRFEGSLNLPSVALTGNPAGPCIEVIPGDVEMGCTIVGTTNWRPVTLRNCGQVAAKIESISWAENSEGLFSLEDVELPIVVSSGEEREIAIGYSPLQGPAQVAPIWDTALLHLDTLGYQDAIAVVTQGFGKTFSCEGLRVVLIWATPGDPDPKDRGPEAGSDMDLHLLHPFALDFFDIPFDVYWYNANPQWGLIDEPSDDPTLSLDDYDSLGPEAIILPLPEEGLTYTVGVHYWSDHDFGPSRAQVQISLFGELVYESPMVEMISGELWEVGTVGWPEGDVLPFEDSAGAPLVHTDFAPPCDVISCGK